MKPQWNTQLLRHETDVRRWQSKRLREYLRTVVLPFSAYYRNLFREHGLGPDSIRTVADLAQIPFTTKADLLSTANHPEHFRDFVLVPDEKILSRRLGVV